MIKIFFFGILTSFLFFENVFATGAGITYFGRLIDPQGHPVTSSSVQFKIQLRTPGNENCLMYEEVQVKDLSGAAGVFSVTINDGTGTRTDSTGISLDKIFSNRGSFNFSSGLCASGTIYNTSPTDGRKIQVMFNDGTFAAGTWEPMPAVPINFVPMAIETMQIGGYKKEQLLRVEDAADTTNTELTVANWNKLLSLLSGSSTQYVSPSSANFTAAPTWSGTPSTANDLVNKNYVDSAVASGLPNVGTAGTYFKVTTDAKGRVTSGAALAESDIPSLSSAGKVSGSSITSGAISGTTSISTSGNLVTTGTVQGATVSSTSNRIFSGTNYVELKAPILSGNISLTLPSGLPASNGYVLSSDTSGNLSWSPSASGALSSTLTNGQIFVGNGSNVATGVTMSGDATLSNTGALTLSTVAVSKGGTGATSFVANKIVGTNVAGDGLTSFSCGVGNVIGFDASGYATCVSLSSMSSFVNGGNSLGANAVLGTSDNYSLTLKANNTTGLTIDTSGGVKVSNFEASKGSSFLKVTPAWWNSSTAGTWVDLDTTGPSGIGTGGPGSNAWIAYASIGGMWFNGTTAGDVIYRNAYARKIHMGIDNGAGNNDPTMTFSGNSVGISNVSPSGTYNLEVGTNTSYGKIYTSGFMGIGAGGSGDRFAIDGPSLVGGKMIVKDNGNVGINNTSPGSTLDVKGTLRLSGATSGYVGFAPAAAAGSTTYTLPAADGSSGQVLQTNGAGQLAWASTLASGGTLTAAVSYNNGPSVVFSGYPTTGFFGNNNDVGISLGGVQKFRANASQTFINGAVTVDGGFILGNAGSGGGSAYSLQMTRIGSTMIFPTSGYLQMGPNSSTTTVYVGSNIGIKNASPGYDLDVTGNINASTSLLIAGTSVCTSTGCTAAPSDQRLKKNVKPLEGALEKILQIQGVSYDWIDAQKYNDKHQIGVIAQEVEKIYPEVVVTNEKTGLKAVSYSYLVAPLIESVKTLHDRQERGIASVQDAQSRIEHLEKENAELKARLEKVETLLRSR